MKGSTPNGGYTIVEVMVFLAVSAAMFISAMALVGGQQNKAQFQTAVKEMESSLTDTLNDVSTGYYRNTANFKCQGGNVAGLYRPKITLSGSDTQGTNDECIFIGRVIQFNVNNIDTDYNVYDIVGLRQYGPSGTKKEVDNIPRAVPTVNDFSVEKHKLKGGLKAGWVHYTNAASSQDATAGVGIFSSFGQPTNTTSTSLKSGASQANLVPIVGLWGASQANVQSKLDAMGVAQLNPPSGIDICFNSGTTDQHAVISIGGQGRPLGANTIITGGTCP